MVPLLQEMVSVAVQSVQDMENIIKDPNKIDTNGSLHSNGNDPYKHFVSMNGLCCTMKILLLTPIYSFIFSL